MDNAFPIAIKEWKRNFIFASIRHYVEDRRPDLSVDEAKTEDIGKYKHFIDVRILWWKYNWTFRTDYEYEDLPFCH